MTQSKTKTIILENDPLHKEKAKWAKKYKSLVGLYIRSIRYMTKEETEANYWYSSPIIIELSDGTALIPQKDDEGNDGGALWIANSKKCKEKLAPVIRG